MRCPTCGQDNLSESLVTLTFEREGSTVVVKDVPGQNCRDCGEEYISEEIAARALEVAEQAVARGSEVEVLRYRVA